MITYVCPHCQAPSAQMRPSDERMEPTAEQRTTHPELDLIGHEILVCKCGEPLTWYDLRPITHYESFAEGIAAGIVPDGALRLHEWAKQMEPNESARQAMAGFGLVINLERLPDMEESFEMARIRIAELMSQVSGFSQ